MAAGYLGLKEARGGEELDLQHEVGHGLCCVHSREYSCRRHECCACPLHDLGHVSREWVGTK